MMRDNTDRLTQAGLRVVAISPQPADSKARFRDKHALQQTLLADQNRVAIKAFGVCLPLGLVRRATFLIDPDGTIADRAVADLRVGPHAKLIERAVQTKS